MGKNKIFVVEDEQVVAEDICESLHEYGYEVCGHALAGDEAIDSILKLKPDLVLMDVKLRGELDGIEVATKVRAEYQVPVVYLTAYSDADTLERAKVTEPYGYLIKPYKEIDLQTTIEVALYKHQANTNIVSDSDSTEVSSDQVSDITKNGSASHGEVYSFLNKIEFFNDLKQVDVEKLAGFAYKKSYSAGEYISIEGDVLDAGYIVVSGRIAIMKSSLSGKDLIVELLPPGDLFGLLCTHEKQPYPYTTKAQVDTDLIWLPKQKLLQALDTVPEISRKFISHTFERLRGAHDLSRSLAHDSVEVRIAAALSALISKFSDASGHNNMIIPLTRQELADLVGTTQETCIRTTRSLEKSGILDLSKNGQIKVVDYEGLLDLSQ